MRLILAELKKIKRHYLLSFSMIIVLFSALLAMFQLVAASGTVRGYLPLTDGIIWNNTTLAFATVYKGNIIKNLIMDCQSYTKYRPNETTGGIFVSWRRKEELPTGA